MFYIRKLAIFITVSAGSIIAALLIALGYIEYRKNLIEKETYEYLLQNHKPHEIYEVRGSLGFGHLFVATVIFENEKNLVYEFGKKDGQIIQLTPEPGIENDKNSK